MKDKKPSVVVPLKTNARHLQQLFTGLESLARKGFISLMYERNVTQHHKASAFIKVDNAQIYIDCSDSPDIHKEEYQHCELYFKRTLRNEDRQTLSKLRPFGLYFEVYPSFCSLMTLRRFLSFSPDGIKGKSKTVVKLLDTDNKLGFMPRESAFYNSKKATYKGHAFKVLFYVRLWDPASDKEFEISDIERTDREKINTSRIKTIRLLKQKFKENALVGVMDDNYSRKVAPDLIVDKYKTTKKQYIRQVNSASVCIATTGLHGSIGAKFAEYVALGKAIVTESFDYVLPGTLDEPGHYLEFNSPEQCVEKVSQLFDTPYMLEQMESMNIRYAQQYMTSDKMVSRIIEEVKLDTFL